MKNINGFPVWIITLILLSLGLSIWAVIIANVDFSKLEFQGDKVITFAGLLFTVIGVVFSFYFFVVQINTNRLKDKMDTLEKEMDEKKKQMEKDLKRIESLNLDNIYSHLLFLAEKTIADKKKRSTFTTLLYRDRARLATQSIFLPEEKRSQRLSELGELKGTKTLGDETDLKDLERIINDPTENEDIRYLAAKVKKQIQDCL